MDKTVINFRLSELRKAKHITQGELAEIVGTSFQTISKWENGITMPDITVLPVLASFFEVSVDELLGISLNSMANAYEEKFTEKTLLRKKLPKLRNLSRKRSRNYDWRIDNMIMMNSVLTVEERCMLQSLGCKDKAQALAVLGEMKMILPIRSDLFAQVVRLSDKLEKEKIDYAYEISAVGLSEDEIA